MAIDIATDIDIDIRPDIDKHLKLVVGGQKYTVAC